MLYASERQPPFVQHFLCHSLTGARNTHTCDPSSRAELIAARAPREALPPGLRSAADSGSGHGPLLAFLQAE